MESNELASREQAGLLLRRIESRILFLKIHVRNAVTALLESGVSYQSPHDLTLTAADLDRFATHWTVFVPESFAVRAHLCRLLGEKYLLSDATPRVQAALGAEFDQLKQAYLQIFGEPIETSFNKRNGASVPSPLDEVFCNEVESELEWRVLLGGEVLFRQGETGDALYILVSGRLAVIMEGIDGHRHVAGEVSPGETVGELAVITGEQRNATVRAIRDSELVRFSRTSFDKLVERRPLVLMPIARTIIARSRRANTTSAVLRPMTVAIAAAGSGVPVEGFAARLAQSLEPFGPTLYLDRARCERRMGCAAPEDWDQQNIAGWLSEQEARYRFVLYECDPQFTSWTRQCLRQADRVLLVGTYGCEPVLNEIEEQVFRAGEVYAKKALVLVHRNSRESGEAHSWLAKRCTDEHHHVTAGCQPDFNRLARFLTGQAIGLVLGGGGARGFAHIGVIKALAEHHIPVDFIGGASMGACIGAQLAMGWDHLRILEETRKCWVDARPLRDYTVPIVSLITAGRLTAAYAEMFGKTRIEDLPTRYFCVSSNLTLGRLEVHQSGLLRKYVRASCSVPGIAPPVPDGRNLLVDGGVLDNLPVNSMAGLWDGGTIIAVDVNPQTDLSIETEYGESLSAGTILWARINPFARTLRIPHIYDILERTTLLHSMSKAHELAQSKQDLYLHPPTTGYGLYEFDSIRTIAEAGYRFAFGELAGWANRRRAEAGI